MSHRATAGSARLRPRKQPRPRRLGQIVASVLIIIGMLIMITPVVITLARNSYQQRVAQSHSEFMAQQEASTLDEELARARQWNDSQNFDVVADPWLSAPDLRSPGYLDYLDQLNLDSVMARLRVPSAKIDLPVYHGTEQKTLARGAGHLYGTDLPIGGVGTHAVITGHTGIATSTLFDHLSDVKAGDLMSVETLGTRYVYRVDQISMVLPEETSLIMPEADHDFLTLITCAPYGVNSHRLLVRGERVEDAADSETDVTGIAWSWWMSVALGFAALFLFFLIVILRNARKR